MAPPHGCGDDAAQRHGRGVIDQLRVAADGARQVPLPASGATAHRFAVLADFAEHDLALGRLVEGHLDVLAILREAGMAPAHPDATYGVWAARSRHGGTLARLENDGWHLSGEKAFCSGSVLLDRALVTAETPDGYRLFDISVPLSVTEARGRLLAGRRDGGLPQRDARFRGPTTERAVRDRASGVLPAASRLLVRGHRGGGVLVGRSSRARHADGRRLGSHFLGGTAGGARVRGCSRGRDARPSRMGGRRDRR